jgi:hypothetical protein
MLDVIAAAAPPTHLLLGSDALGLVRENLAGRLREFDAWEKLTVSTDG